MASSYAISLEVSLPPEQTEAAVYQAFLHAGIGQVAGGGGIMRGKVGAGWQSWGEDVLAIIGHGPRGTVVQLRSESTLPTTLVDWGRNRQNLERVVAALRALAPVI